MLRWACIHVFMVDDNERRRSLRQSASSEIPNIWLANLVLPRPAHNIFRLSCEIQSSKCVTGVTTQALHVKTCSAISMLYFAPGGRCELLIRPNPFQLMLIQ